MLEQIEETIKQGKELFAKKKPLPKPLCPICNHEMEWFDGGTGEKGFYRCIHLHCDAVGIARYLQGIKPNE